MDLKVNKLKGARCLTEKAMVVLTSIAAVLFQKSLKDALQHNSIAMSF